MIRFKTKRLIIRDIEEKDLMFLLSIYTEKQNMRYISSGKYDWTLNELKEKYKAINKDYCNGFGIFTVEIKGNGIIIGEAGLFNSFGNSDILELGYIIDQDFWKQGFGTELCKGLIHYAFTTLKVQKVVARMYTENSASVRLSEKAGMTRTESGITDNYKTYIQYEIENPSQIIK